jgi:hypothetical protein
MTWWLWLLLLILAVAAWVFIDWVLGFTHRKL